MILINGIFAVFMVALAVVDFRSYRTRTHKDFKSVIMSVGILGTFFGIFWGLQDFDTRNIQESVPMLLEGLKIAFFTSIMGMGLAILLTVLQKMNPTRSQERKESDFVLGQMEKLDYLEHLDQMRGLDKLELLNHLIALEKHNRGVYNRLGDFIEEYKTGQQALALCISEGLDANNQTLEKAIGELAKGASGEIIKALEQVISDFNTNLTEQFGDNFQQLNQSVDNLIRWQENYKSSVEVLERDLSSAAKTLEQTNTTFETIASRNQEVLNVHERLGGMLETQQGQLDHLNSQLEHYAGLKDQSVSAFEMMQQLFVTMQQQLESFASQSSTHLETLKSEIVSSLQESVQSGLSAHRDYAQGILEHSKNHHQVMTETMIGNLDGIQNHIASQHENLKTQVSSQITMVSDSLQEVREGILSQVSQMMDRIEEAQKQMLENTESGHNQLSQSLMQTIQNLQAELSVLERVAIEKVEHLGENLINVNERYHESLQGNLSKMEEGVSRHLRGVVEDAASHMQNLNSEMLTSANATQQSLQEILGETRSGFADTMGFMREEFKNSADEVVSGFEKTNQALRNVFTKLIRNINHSNQELKKLYTTQVEESAQLFINLSSQANTSLASIRKSLDVTMQELVGDGGKMLQSLSSEMKTNLSSMIKELDSHFIQAKTLMESNTTELAQKYVQFLETSIKETTDAPKNLTQDMEESFKKLQQELRAYALNTHTSIRDSKTDMEQVLISMHESLNSQIKDNRHLHDELQKSLRSLDGSLGSLTEQFKQDYEWFLKRIRELIGTHHL